MKRVRLALRLLIAAALLGGTPALADQPITTTLTGVADETDPDFGASGTAKLSNIKSHYYWSGSFLDNYYYEYFSGDLTVKCDGLTPGATYQVPDWGSGIRFTASPTGAGAVTLRNITFAWGWIAPRVVVYREDTVNGAVQLVPVLEGTFSQ